MSRKRGHNPYKQPDVFTRRAKAAGYAARSVFKLEEIDRRVGLLKGGMRVLDLGAAPGSWSIYAAERIGPSGRLLAIDLKPLETPPPPPHQALCGDARELEAAIAERAPYDLVLSDMAPNTIGDKQTDQWRSYELFAWALEIATRHLRPGGSFCGKLFMSAELEQAKKAARAAFEEVRILRPDAVRARSYEVFVVARRRRAPDPAPG